MKRSLSCVLFGAAVAAVAVPAWADVELPPLFSNGAVLQRDAQVPIFGTADAGEAVTVELDGQTATTTADAEGKWRVTLEPLDGVGPHTLVVRGKNELTRTDLLAGDVWIAGGQSNMEWRVSQSNDAEAEIATADYPQIRLFTVEKATSAAPVESVRGQWQPATPQTVGNFSAVAYFFGRKLHEETGVPIGLISSNWGGTPVEAWIPEAALIDAGFEEAVQVRDERIASGAFDSPESQRLEDTGNTKAGWARPEMSTRGWATLPVPGPFLMEEIDFDGAVWFRRDVTVPPALAGQPMTLRLGAIDDADITYFNGVEIGRTDDWSAERVYEVPAELVKPGRNVIAVRVFDIASIGGFTAEPRALKLVPTEGAAIPLAGEWNVAVEQIVARNPDDLRRLQSAPPQNTPTMLYNAMIAPMSPYAARGFIWYQGESNAGNPQPYAALLRAMIEAWRDDFAGPDEQPFYIVQLANFQQRSSDPAVNDGWAQLREAQRQVATDANNGLATAIDIGEAGDIHPRNKQDVGQRLALLALRDVYGQDVIARGPTATQASVEDGKVTITFESAEGLELRGDGSAAFAVGDAQGNWAWATPKVEGDAIVLAVDGIGAPAIVRYAWQINPPTPLYNAAGLPATPFELKVEASDDSDDSDDSDNPPVE